MKNLVYRMDDEIVSHDVHAYVKVWFYEDGSTFVKLYGAMVANRDVTGGVDFDEEGISPQRFVDSFSNEEITSTHILNAAVNHARRLRTKALAEVRIIAATHSKETP